MPRATTSESEPVTFRLGGELLAKLMAQADAEGKSRGELAREYVIAALEDDVRRRMLSDMAELGTGLEKLRSDVAVTLEAVLLNVAQVSEDEVKAFVSANLRS
jgi:hypothetical protein